MRRKINHNHAKSDAIAERYIKESPQTLLLEDPVINQANQYSRYNYKFLRCISLQMQATVGD